MVWGVFFAGVQRDSRVASAGRGTCSITLNRSGSGCNVRFVSSGTGWGYTTYRLEERHGVVFPSSF